jgi:MFS family permease
VNVSFAALQMNRDLGFTNAVYGFGAGLFFVTYCLLEVPSNLLLYRFGATRWIARIMFTWGLCAMAMAFVKGAASFYTVRLVFGAAEAGFYPGVLFFLTLWFPAAYRGRILGLFISSAAISGIIGSPLSGLLLSLDGTAGLKGWQWLYIVEALPAIVLAPVVLTVLKDGPAHAKWLPEDERRWLADTLETEARHVDRAQTASPWRAITHPLVWLLALSYFANVCLLNGTQFFLPQIVSSFGLSHIQTGFVVAIPSALALVTMIWWGRRSDTHRERFGHAAAAMFIGAVTLLAAMQLQDPAIRVALIAVSVAFTLAFTGPFWSIPGTFLSRAAAAGGIAAISSLGVTGGFITPWFVGRSRDLTGDFRAGLSAVAIFAMVVAGVFFVFGRRAARAAAGR